MPASLFHRRELRTRHQLGEQTGGGSLRQRRSSGGAHIRLVQRRQVSVQTEGKTKAHTREVMGTEDRKVRRHVNSKHSTNSMPTVKCKSLPGLMDVNP